MEDIIIERPFYTEKIRPYIRQPLDNFALGTTAEGIQIVHLKEFLLRDKKITT